MQSMTANMGSILPGDSNIYHLHPQIASTALGKPAIMTAVTARGRLPREGSFIDGAKMSLVRPLSRRMVSVDVSSLSEVAD
jgi:hypothetical protein